MWLSTSCSFMFNQMSADDVSATSLSKVVVGWQPKAFDIAMSPHQRSANSNPLCKSPTRQSRDIRRCSLVPLIATRLC